MDRDTGAPLDAGQAEIQRLVALRAEQFSRMRRHNAAALAAAVIGAWLETVFPTPGSLIAWAGLLVATVLFSRAADAAARCKGYSPEWRYGSVFGVLWLLGQPDLNESRLLTLGWQPPAAPPREKTNWFLVLSVWFAAWPMYPWFGKLMGHPIPQQNVAGPYSTALPAAAVILAGLSLWICLRRKRPPLAAILCLVFAACSLTATAVMKSVPPGNVPAIGSRNLRP